MNTSRTRSSFGCFDVGFLSLALVAVSAATVTNSDVEKLLSAGMDDSVILNVIASPDSKFDTSTDALIALKGNGASPAVIAAIAAGPRPVAPALAKSSRVKTLEPRTVLSVANGQEKRLTYSTVTCRMQTRGFGYGGSTAYASLPGLKAHERIAAATPEFVVSIPEEATAQSYVTLIRLEPRSKEDVRELKIGFVTFVSTNTTIPPERIVSVTLTKMDNQDRAAAGQFLYNLKPEKCLESGEYALILNCGTTNVNGLGNSGTTNLYFDFGL